MTILHARPASIIECEENKDYIYEHVSESYSKYKHKIYEFFKTYELLPTSVNIFLIDGQNIFNNEEWEKNLGATPNFFTSIFPEDLSKITQAIQPKNNLDSKQIECRMLTHNQNYEWFALRIKSYFLEEIKQTIFITTAANIQNRKIGHFNLMEQLGAYENMLDVSVDCIKVVDVDGHVQHMNLSGRKALGVPLDEKTFGMKWLDLLPIEVRGRGRKALRQAVNGESARFAGKSVGAGITQYWDNILTPIVDENGTTRSILCVSRDVTSLKIAENKLRQSSELDDLTGLYNRRLFKTRLRRVLANAKEKQQMAGVLLIDLDHFKHVNDTLGHSAGDHLLRVLSKRLQSILGDQGFIARLGGDEFAIAVGGLNSEEEFIKIAELASQQLDAPVSYAGKYINGGMSIGCAIYPRDAQDSSCLIQCVDTALNDLKADGRGGIRFYNEQMLIDTEITAKQLNLARKIIRQDLVTPYYQPKIDLITRKIVGFEALLRWRCPDLGIQLPIHVQEAFKDYKLASKISELMHNKIFTELAQCIEIGLEVVPVAINVAPVEFLRDDYAENFLARVDKFGIPYHLIEIEVTEQILEDRGSNFVLRALEMLKRKGIKISLDDFGTGHSSLTRLKDYPVDCLKIDKSFINLVATDKTILAVVQAISELGPKLNLDIVAEGIETEEQLNILIESCCGIGQGYYFSPAVDLQGAIDVLKKYS